jgi:hypothetical protein
MRPFLKLFTGPRPILPVRKMGEDVLAELTFFIFLPRQGPGQSDSASAVFIDDVKAHEPQ